MFEGFTTEDIDWIGGESIINETVGLGGFAQAAAFPLQNYQGGSPQAMVEMNLAMYEITVGEHTDYRIPFLAYRGTPTGIDVFRAARTGITPALDVGLAGRERGPDRGGDRPSSDRMLHQSCSEVRIGIRLGADGPDAVAGARQGI